jgi:hypothetical protein
VYDWRVYVPGGDDVEGREGLEGFEHVQGRASGFGGLEIWA